MPRREVKGLTPTSFSRAPRKNEMTLSRLNRLASGFTLIELVVVISIIGIALGLFGLRAGSFSFYREDAFVRQLTEKIGFLHQQAVADQAFYRLEFNFNEDLYRIGAMRDEPSINLDSSCSNDKSAGILSCSLADALFPSLSQGGEQTMIPPPNFPSLAEPVHFPAGVRLIDVKTENGSWSRDRGGIAALIFYPRGFSDFAVLHLEMRGSEQLTILVNPFTGIPERYPGYVDFEATFGKRGD